VSPLADISQRYVPLDFVLKLVKRRFCCFFADHNAGLEASCPFTRVPLTRTVSHLQGITMAAPDMDVIKDIPGYKIILKAVLKSQIQQLVSY